jgi:flagellar basal body rod protein FlgG
MSHDIYPSLSGASAAWRHLEVISNNLSNTSTNGYKEQRLSFESALVSEGPLGEGYVAAAPTEQDFSDGRMVTDNVMTHMALSGRGFFQLEDGSLTRAGDFMLNHDNFLVTPDGQKVVGNNGPIQILLNSEMRVRTDGTIMLDGEVFDRFALVDADEVESVGGNRWRTDGTVYDANAEVIQGALEASNVDPMRSMTDLIQTSRYFEVYRSAMKASDEMDRTNINIARES